MKESLEDLPKNQKKLMKIAYSIFLNPLSCNESEIMCYIDQI